MIPLSFQIEDPLSSQIAWPELHVAHVGPVRSWREAGGIQWCRIQRAFSRRVVQKQLHLQRPITQLQPWYRPASIHPPALVRSQSSWSIAGAHYEHWTITFGILVSPHFLAGISYIRTDIHNITIFDNVCLIKQSNTQRANERGDDHIFLCHVELYGKIVRVKDMRIHVKDMRIGIRFSYT